MDDSGGRIDPRAHQVLAGASRVRVLEHLRARRAPLTAPEIAEGVGLHPNTVRLHLDQLLGAGLVTRQTQGSGARGRPRVLYAATPPPLPAEPPESDGYRQLAGVLAARLDATGERAADDAAAAGRAWGRATTERRGTAATAAEATDHLVQVMDRLGFQPSAAAPDGTIALHHCPFRQVAEQHSRVVCGVHLGLMQGALENLGAPLRATRLEPFVTPELCLAHLGAAPNDPRPNPHPTEGPPS